MLPGDDRPNPPLPEPTAAAIRSVYAPPCPCTPDRLRSLDDRILAQARQLLAAPQRRSVWTLPRTLALAAAATLAIAASAWFVNQSVRNAPMQGNRPSALGSGGLATSGTHGGAPPTPTNNRSAGDRDLNHDGRVDILDALALAKAIDTNSPELARWSLTRGRGVGQADVDALASSVVQLRSAGRGGAS